MGTATYRVTGDGYLMNAGKKYTQFFKPGELITVDEDTRPSGSWIPVDEAAHKACERAMAEFLPPLKKGERDLLPDGKTPDEQKRGRRQLEEQKARTWGKDPKEAVPEALAPGEDEDEDEAKPTHARRDNPRTLAESAAQDRAMGKIPGVPAQREREPAPSRPSDKKVG